MFIPLSACRYAATEIKISQSETGDLTTSETCLTYLIFGFFSGSSRVVEGAAANHGTFSTVGDRRGGKEGRRSLPSLIKEQEQNWSLISLFSQRKQC